MIDKLYKKELVLLNRLLPKTTESSSFNIFEMLPEFNEGLTAFDKGYIFGVDATALRISNFLINKGLAEKVHPDKPAFERILQWTEKGVRFKKYKNYHLYKFMVDIRPETAKLFAWLLALAGVISLIFGIISFLAKR